MLDNYDFSGAIKNPFAEALNGHKTIILDDDIIEYFEDMSDRERIPYQTLINLYLADCMNNRRKLNISWSTETK